MLSLRGTSPNQFRFGVSLFMVVLLGGMAFCVNSGNLLAWADHPLNEVSQSVCQVKQERPDGSSPITPHEIIRPFNGKDLSGFTTWLKQTGRDDPQHVFRVENGMIRCGAEDMGYLSTKDEYQNYHLVVEYKWGQKPVDSKYVRNSGILLHGVGPDGSSSGVWMTSVECQLAQGCEGDLILIPGKTAEGQPYPATITSTTRIAEDKKTRYQPGGRKTLYTGKQFWWSKHQPFFEELLDTRGKDDVASPLGEWTKVECICSEARITIKINGETVNECFDAKPSAGKILLQTEGYEVFFRNLEIRPLDNSFRGACNLLAP